MKIMFEKLTFYKNEKKVVNVILLRCDTPVLNEITDLFDNFLIL